MNKHVKQFRYYGFNDENNYPIDIDSKLSNGTIFEDYMPICQLGIQTLPGTKFFLNDPYQQRELQVNYTGIFELSFNDAKISSLSFKDESLATIDSIPGAYLIVDVVYEGVN